MLGVPGTGRRIRKALTYLSVAQAQMIAQNGMARAMHEANYHKMLRLGIGFKQALADHRESASGLAQCPRKGQAIRSAPGFSFSSEDAGAAGGRFDVARHR